MHKRNTTSPTFFHERSALFDSGPRLVAPLQVAIPTCPTLNATMHPCDARRPTFFHTMQACFDTMHARSATRQALDRCRPTLDEALQWQIPIRHDRNETYPKVFHSVPLFIGLPAKDPNRLSLGASS